jgi:hypothetical protein
MGAGQLTRTVDALRVLSSDRFLADRFSAIGLHCTDFGAENTSKKSLDSAQNPENKGPEILRPPRSMVLKVVRGKILETLEL